MCECCISSTQKLSIKILAGWRVKIRLQLFRKSKLLTQILMSCMDSTMVSKCFIHWDASFHRSFYLFCPCRHKPIGNNQSNCWAFQKRNGYILNRFGERNTTMAKLLASACWAARYLQKKDFTKNRLGKMSSGTKNNDPRKISKKGLRNGFELDVQGFIATLPACR